jgi:hypothetical protein
MRRSLSGTCPWTEVEARFVEEVSIGPAVVNDDEDPSRTGLFVFGARSAEHRRERPGRVRRGPGFRLSMAAHADHSALEPITASPPASPAPTRGRWGEPPAVGDIGAPSCRRGGAEPGPTGRPRHPQCFPSSPGGAHSCALPRRRRRTRPRDSRGNRERAPAVSQLLVVRGANYTRPSGHITRAVRPVSDRHVRALHASPGRARTGSPTPSYPSPTSPSQRTGPDHRWPAPR